MVDSVESVSLIWPDVDSKNKYEHVRKLSEKNIIDFGIEKIIRHMSEYSGSEELTEKLILNVCDDPEILRYRIDIVSDLYQQTGILNELETYLPEIRGLQTVYHQQSKDIHAEAIRKVTWRLELLRKYVACVNGLYAILYRNQQKYESAGLRRLLARVTEITESEQFQNLQQHIPELRRQLLNMQSVTIGINLDHHLKPVEAVFLSVEPRPFKKQSILSKFFGLRSNDEKYNGMSQFHSLALGSGAGSAIDEALFRDLNDVFQAALTPIGGFLRQYVNVNIQWLFELERELAFYSGAVRLINKLSDAGLAMCKPEVLEPGARSCDIRNGADLMLAIQLLEEDPNTRLDKAIVTNDIHFGSEGRVFILTGANQGGKTTYTRSIALAHLMMQIGLYVPGTYAAMSPADWIYSHFSEDEKPTVQFGRLGEESKRLAEIFLQATPNSLVLMNESFSSTSPGESLYLCRDVVKGLKLLGCKAVFATHHHDLAAEVDTLNASTPGDGVLISMVAGVDRSYDHEQNEDKRYESKKKSGRLMTRTYKVTPGPPQGTSFAKDIADLYGISYEHISDILVKREVLPEFIHKNKNME